LALLLKLQQGKSEKRRAISNLKLMGRRRTGSLSWKFATGESDKERELALEAVGHIDAALRKREAQF
jgi:hypothetical protein